MLVKYGCGCIGFPLDHPLTKTVKKPDGKEVQQPCIIRACDSDWNDPDYTFFNQELNAENYRCEPLDPEREAKIWKEIFDLVAEGYDNRTMAGVLSRMLKGKVH